MTTGNFSCTTALNSGQTKGRFDGYIVLVTGGCSGIGKAAVERFANDGATVYALDIRIQSEVFSSQNVSCIELDITNREKCLQVVADIASRHNGTIHTLTNVAGILFADNPEHSLEKWEKTFKLNVLGQANMVLAVKPFMTPGKGCSIVNISSAAAHRACLAWDYSASKGAVSSLTRCLAVELSSQGIRVNCISPGPIFTPMLASVTGWDQNMLDTQLGKLTVMGRVGEPEEVAAVIAFLASQDASFITGADIPVCGGGLALIGLKDDKQTI